VTPPRRENPYKTRTLGASPRWQVAARFPRRSARQVHTLGVSRWTPSQPVGGRGTANRSKPHGSAPGVETSWAPAFTVVRRLADWTV